MQLIHSAQQKAADKITDINLQLFRYVCRAAKALERLERKMESTMGSNDAEKKAKDIMMQVMALHEKNFGFKYDKVPKLHISAINFPVEGFVLALNEWYYSKPRSFLVSALKDGYAQAKNFYETYAGMISLIDGSILLKPILNEQGFCQHTLLHEIGHVYINQEAEKISSRQKSLTGEKRIIRRLYSEGLAEMIAIETEKLFDEDKAIEQEADHPVYCMKKDSSIAGNSELLNHPHEAGYHLVRHIAFYKSATLKELIEAYTKDDFPSVEQTDKILKSPWRVIELSERVW